VSRALGIFGGQLAQLCFCLNVTQGIGVPQALMGLISEILGTFGHEQPSVKATLPKRSKQTCSKKLIAAEKIKKRHSKNQKGPAYY
jgi:hypothetical protein